MHDRPLAFPVRREGVASLKRKPTWVYASSANTAIVHAGYDLLPGSLKARMNVKGNAMWDTLAGELNFAFERRA